MYISVRVGRFKCISNCYLEFKGKTITTKILEIQEELKYIFWNYWRHFITFASLFIYLYRNLQFFIDFVYIKKTFLTIIFFKKVLRKGADICKIELSFFTLLIIPSIVQLFQKIIKCHLNHLNNYQEKCTNSSRKVLREKILLSNYQK